MTDDRRASAIYALLVVLTVVAVVFTTPFAHDLLTAKGAFCIATVVAFVKVRFVVMDFMELRGTAIARFAEAWILVVGLISLALILR